MMSNVKKWIASLLSYKFVLTNETSSYTSFVPIKLIIKFSYDRGLFEIYLCVISQCENIYCKMYTEKGKVF